MSLKMLRLVSGKELRQILVTKGYVTTYLCRETLLNMLRDWEIRRLRMNKLAAKKEHEKNRKIYASKINKLLR